MRVLSPGGAPAIRGHGVTGGTAYAETRPSKPITLKAKLQHISCLAFAPNGKTLAARVGGSAPSPGSGVTRHQHEQRLVPGLLPRRLVL